MTFQVFSRPVSECQPAHGACRLHTDRPLYVCPKTWRGVTVVLPRRIEAVYRGRAGSRWLQQLLASLGSPWQAAAVGEFVARQPLLREPLVARRRFELDRGAMLNLVALMCVIGTANPSVAVSKLASWRLRLELRSGISALAPLGPRFHV